MHLCANCAAARETRGAWLRFDPACLFCGARLVQQLGTLAVSAAAIKARRKAVLDDWQAYGHSRAEMRRLAQATGLPLPPFPKRGG